MVTVGERIIMRNYYITVTPLLAPPKPQSIDVFSPFGRNLVNAIEQDYASDRNRFQFKPCDIYGRAPRVLESHTDPDPSVSSQQIGNVARNAGLSTGVVDETPLENGPFNPEVGNMHCDHSINTYRVKPSKGNSFKQHSKDFVFPLSPRTHIPTRITFNDESTGFLEEMPIENITETSPFNPEEKTVHCEQSISNIGKANSVINETNYTHSSSFQHSKENNSDLSFGIVEGTPFENTYYDKVMKDSIATTRNTSMKKRNMDFLKSSTSLEPKRIIYRSQGLCSGILEKTPMENIAKTRNISMKKRNMDFLKSSTSLEPKRIIYRSQGLCSGILEKTPMENICKETMPNDSMMDAKGSSNNLSDLSCLGLKANENVAFSQGFSTGIVDSSLPKESYDLMNVTFPPLSRRYNYYPDPSMILAANEISTINETAPLPSFYKEFNTTNGCINSSDRSNFSVVANTIMTSEASPLLEFNPNIICNNLDRMTQNKENTSIMNGGSIKQLNLDGDAPFKIKHKVKGMKQTGAERVWYQQSPSKINYPNAEHNYLRSINAEIGDKNHVVQKINIGTSLNLKDKGSRCDKSIMHGCRASMIDDNNITGYKQGESVTQVNGFSVKEVGRKRKKINARPAKIIHAQGKVDQGKSLHQITPGTKTNYEERTLHQTKLSDFLEVKKVKSNCSPVAIPQDLEMILSDSFIETVFGGSRKISKVPKLHQTKLTDMLRVIKSVDGNQKKPGGGAVRQ